MWKILITLTLLFSANTALAYSVDPVTFSDVSDSINITLGAGEYFTSYDTLGSQYNSASSSISDTVSNLTDSVTDNFHILIVNDTEGACYSGASYSDCIGTYSGEVLNDYTITYVASTTAGATTGPNFNEWLFVAGVFLFFISLRSWDYIFRPVKELFA